MDDDYIFMDYLFMALVILYSVYQLFINKSLKGLEVEITEKIRARPIVNVIRYLMFLAFNSFFAGMFFDNSWLLCISFFSVLALWILLIDHKINFSYCVLLTLMILFFIGAGVPNHHDSFKEYVSKNTEYKCLRIECIKITEVVTEGTLRTKVKAFTIEDYSFDWYPLFAKGGLSLKDDDGDIQVIQGINIGGLWLVDK
ncbi:hypothetical protein [Mesobacillus jeotgali]|uniref:hypothetical protein n=1 Tax=Mesobacillus jeotgali TaxID=129985 RepID=UPI0009A6CC0B|nr:hypothetical protein [Mesobacillus jeotgali]